MKTAILGAGLTGLTVGYLMANDSDFELLEKEEKCGGLMKSIQEEGFTFDCYGSHIIFSKNKKVLSFMLDLLKDNKIKRRRNTKILYKGHYVRYPFETGLSDLPKQDNFECLYYFIQNLINKEFRAPNNLKEWFYFTFGKGITEKYLINYNEKIWKYPLEKIGLDWVERVPNPPLEDIIKSSLGFDVDGYTHQLCFYYPKIGGIEALVRALETKINKHIYTNFEVKKIKKEDKNWIISDGKVERAYSRIISTIPIFDIIHALNPPNIVKNAAETLKYNSLITVMIGVNEPKVNDFSWLYIPDKDILTHRVSFPSNYSPHVAPSGKSSILAEITCKDDDLWKMKDEELIDRTIEDLHMVKILNKEEICFTKITRTKYAYPIYDINYKKNMRLIYDYVRTCGIDLIGRFAEFKYLNMDECIRSAFMLVRNK